jgi:hypothetical protein
VRLSRQPLDAHRPVNAMLTVLELAEAAVAETQDDPEGSALTVAAALRLLDVYGTRNAHLENPLNHPGRGWVRPRDIPLSGAEPVHGAFLAFKYCAHDPTLQLIDFDDITSLEQMLASNYGIVNHFITYCVAFIDGKVARYQVAYRDNDGGTGLFDKYVQNAQGPQPAERAVDRWVVWDAHAQPKSEGA